MAHSEFRCHGISGNRSGFIPVFRLGDGETPNSSFKEDYLREIKRFVTQRALILVSTDEELRNGLKDMGWKYTLVFPEKDLKDEWLRRLEARKSDNLAFRLQENWDKWISACKNRDCTMTLAGFRSSCPIP